MFTHGCYSMRAMAKIWALTPSRDGSCSSRRTSVRNGSRFLWSLKLAATSGKSHKGRSKRRLRLVIPLAKNCLANVIYNLLRNPWSSTHPGFSHRRITRHQNIHDGGETSEDKAPLGGQVILIRTDPYAMHACAIQCAKHVCQQRGIEALATKRRKRSAIPDVGFTRLKTKAQP